MTALRIPLVGLVAALGSVVLPGPSGAPAFAAPDASAQGSATANGAAAGNLAVKGDRPGSKSDDDDDDDDDDKPEAKPGPDKPDQTKSGQSKPDRSKPEQGKADQGGGDRVKPDQAEPDQAKADDDDDDDQPAVAKARFPQPVQVGQLIGRDVLQPLESQPLLGRVRRLVRKSDGAIDVIVNYGGWFGWGSRPIAVPLSAMALLGADMSIIGYTPAQLAALPTVAADAGQVLPSGETIRVGLTKPAH